MDSFVGGFRDAVFAIWAIVVAIVALVVER